MNPPIFPDEFYFVGYLAQLGSHSAQVGQNKTTRRREVRQVFLCVRWFGKDAR